MSERKPKDRKHVTLSEVTLGRADKLISARGFDNLSEFITSLIREEYERRHPPAVQPLHEDSPPYKVTPSPGADTSHKSEVSEAIHNKVEEMKRRRKAGR